MRVHKMTKYDAGQDLIYCADKLGEKERDLREGGYPELAKVLRKYRLAIGTVFNKLNSHVFGLPDTADEKRRSELIPLNLTKLDQAVEEYANRKVLEEREACAKIAEAYTYSTSDDKPGMTVAQAIRSRSATK